VPDASVGVTVGVEGCRTPAASGGAEQNYPTGDNLPAFPKMAPQAPRGMLGPGELNLPGALLSSADDPFGAEGGHNKRHPRGGATGTVYVFPRIATAIIAGWGR
jgi:hypothetical protein